jgi:hypothetical protein
MKQYSFIPLLTVVMLWLSCTKTAKVNFPDHHPLLVVHGYNAVGDTFHIYLGRTLALSEPAADSNSFVKNGWVLLYRNNQFADSLKYDDARKAYIARTVVAQTGGSYKIVAGAPGFETVEAVSAVPLQVPTTSLSRVPNARTTSEGIPLDDIRFTFNDPSSEKNFYLAVLFSSLPPSTFCVYSYDPVIEKYTGDLLPFNQSGCINSNEIIFNDKTFNGSTKSITISAEGVDINPVTDPATGKTRRAYLKRFNIIEDHYKYFKDIISLNAMDGPVFANPVFIKGNVKNGYGVFSVFTVATDSIP